MAGAGRPKPSGERLPDRLTGGFAGRAAWAYVVDGAEYGGDLESQVSAGGGAVAAVVRAGRTAAATGADLLGRVRKDLVLPVVEQLSDGS